MADVISEVCSYQASRVRLYFFGKALNKLLFMLIHTLGKVAGYADIEGLRTVSHDVHVVLLGNSCRHGDLDSSLRSE